MGVILSVMSYFLPGPEETVERVSRVTQTEKREGVTITTVHHSDSDNLSENSWSGSEARIMNIPRDEWEARSLIPSRQEAAERCRRRLQRQRLAVMRGRL